MGGGLSLFFFFFWLTRGEGWSGPSFLADIICEQPLMFSILSPIQPLGQFSLEIAMSVCVFWQRKCFFSLTFWYWCYYPHTSLCSKPICLTLGRLKTDFVFTPNSIFYIVCHLSDHLDQASHLRFVEFEPPLFCVVFLKINPTISFTAYLTTQIVQQRCKKKKKNI